MVQADAEADRAILGAYPLQAFICDHLLSAIEVWVLVTELELSQAGPLVGIIVDFCVEISDVQIYSMTQIGRRDRNSPRRRSVSGSRRCEPQMGVDKLQCES